MKDTSENEGPLYCPTCNYHIGTYKWAGSQCSCGSWVVPSFQFPKSRVDKKEKVKIIRVDYRQMHHIQNTVDNIENKDDDEIKVENKDNVEKIM